MTANTSLRQPVEGSGAIHLRESQHPAYIAAPSKATRRMTAQERDNERSRGQSPISGIDVDAGLERKRVGGLPSKPAPEHTLTESTGNGRRARILQLAYACAPQRGSEPGVGWNRAVEAAKYSDVWVVTEGTEFQHQILTYLQETGDVPGLHFVFLPRTTFQQLLSGIPGCYYPAYNLWHRRAFRVARQLHQETPFDLVHQVNMSGFREPGYLWKLDVPFIWGPIGGTQNYPTRMLTEAGVLGAFREASRTILNYLQLRHSRRVHKAARRATVMLVANTTIQRQVEQVLGRKTEVMCEIGAKSITEHFSPRGGGDALRLLWSGVFQVRKALPLLLKAIATLPDDVRIELRVLGDGPQRARWQRISRRLGLNDRVAWLGWRPFAEALAEFDRADLFVFTSLRDTTGTVVLEALANGVPVLAPDHQGARDIVTSDSGIRVKVVNPKEAIDSYCTALVRLARDRDLLTRLSSGARQRAGEYLWKQQGERMRDYYRGVLGDGFLWSERQSASAG